MKKISIILVALFAALSTFAAKETAPTDADLADYYQKGQLCVCVYFEEEVCNDVVFAGSYNNWATDDVSALAKFETVTGFDGWYVVAVTDSTLIKDPAGSIKGKPVQLTKDGKFDWDYQTGDVDSWTLVRGTVTIKGGYPGEADLQDFSTAAPVVLISSYFKNHNSPCVAEIRHDYTVYLKAPICADAESNYFSPAIIGSFNGWSEGVAMELDEETMEYSYTFNDKEGGQFKFKAFGDTDWSNQIQILGKDSTGADIWEDNQNITLTADTVVHVDYSAGRYTLCVEETAVDNTGVEKVAAFKYYDAARGQLIIIKGDERYNVLGTKVE